MIIKKAEFVISAVKEEQYPIGNDTDIAFIGRSNAGKSSLLNALAGRRNLAKHGKKPGITALINFFNINDLFYFVDLPGYGYARTARAERENWEEIINKYLAGRKQLKLIIMITDIRHIPNANDYDMYNWIRYNEIPNIVIASKSDKIPKSQIKKSIENIRNTLQIPQNISILPVSSLNKTGIEELWELIEASLPLKDMVN